MKSVPSKKQCGKLRRNEATVVSALFLVMSASCLATVTTTTTTMTMPTSTEEIPASTTTSSILFDGQIEVYYRKCCREDEFYHTDVERMVAKCKQRSGVNVSLSSGESFSWEPWTVYDEYLLPLDVQERIDGSRLVTMNASVGFPVCSWSNRSYMALMDPTDVFQLMDSGSVYIPAFHKSYAPPMYCLDETLVENRPNDFFRQPVVLLCVEDGRQFAPRALPTGFMYPVISACLLVSAASLMATVFVYFVTPEGWNLHGETLQCHVGSLSLGYLFLFSARVVTKRQLEPMAVCKAIGILAHFFLLSAFFWLNVMCFDVFWTIRRFRSRENMGNPRQWKKFFKYCTYAFGAPLLISGIALGLDLSEANSVLNPRFSDSSLHCWFAGSDWAIFAYFYGPVAVLLALNTIMFAFTIRHLVQHEKDTAALRENKRSAAQNKKRLVLYLELFVIMGLTWVAEVISWKLGSAEFWFIFDILNALQGVFIFFIFVCKPKILRHLKDYFTRKRWLCCAGRRALTRSVSSDVPRTGSSKRGSSSATQQTFCSRLSSSESGSKPAVFMNFASLALGSLRSGHRRSSSTKPATPRTERRLNKEKNSSENVNDNSRPEVEDRKNPDDSEWQPCSVERNYVKHRRLGSPRRSIDSASGNYNETATARAPQDPDPNNAQKSSVGSAEIAKNGATNSSRSNAKVGEQCGAKGEVLELPETIPEVTEEMSHVSEDFASELPNELSTDPGSMDESKL